MNQFPRSITSTLALSCALLTAVAACSSSNGGTASGAGGLAGNETADSGAGGAAGNAGSGGTTGGAGGGAGSTGGGGSDPGGPCGAGDTNLPAEPTIPPACATLEASFTATPGTPPSEASLDTARIQAALGSCGAGHSLRLAPSGAFDSFITGPISIPAGVTLWVDAGATLFGTRDPNVYASASALISVRGASSGIVGDGVIDGQGGEPQIGATQSWWDVNGNNGSSPALIQVAGATSFTLYRITLHNSPMFHVKLGANGFVVWGVTIKTPTAAKNSAGTALSPSSAHNTDGIDPGEAASNGTIVCSKISVGDDDIAIKGGTGVKNLTIAHNHFGAGHGMSIGSETNGGVSDVNVYDLSIDGMGSGQSGGSSNGIRIKSDVSRGGLVQNITYSDVCTRDLTNPIILNPRYSMATGTLIPQYTGITIQNFHSISTSVTPKITIDGYDAMHLAGITLDNVVVDRITAANVSATYANITLGPGGANFTAAGTRVTVTDMSAAGATPNPCTGKWVTF